jgi:hypothetical protein
VALTVRQITDGRQPILHVVHDAEDGMWQFLTDGPFEMADAMLVLLKNVFILDATIGELADLPLGWTADRKAVGEDWQRRSYEHA